MKQFTQKQAILSLNTIINCKDSINKRIKEECMSGENCGYFDKIITTFEILKSRIFVEEIENVETETLIHVFWYELSLLAKGEYFELLK